MYLSRSPTFRFWVTVYAFPAMIPLSLSVAYSYLVAPQVEVSLGHSGILINARVNTALTVTFVVFVLLANAFAFWHSWTGLPAIPKEIQPPARQGPSLWWRFGAVFRGFGAHRAQ